MFTNTFLFLCDVLFLITLIIIFISNPEMIHSFLFKQKLEINLTTVCKSLNMSVLLL